MSDAFQTQNTAPVLQFKKCKEIQERRLFERNIESRLRDLGDVVEDLVDAPYPGVLIERGYIREALEELAVKQITLIEIWKKTQQSCEKPWTLPVASVALVLGSHRLISVCWLSLKWRSGVFR